jgi:Uncharacterized protein conserved in bacteria
MRILTPISAASPRALAGRASRGGHGDPFKRWTREQAIDYLAKNTPNTEADCTDSINRYIVMPSQATAYKVGMLKILELREKAKKSLGDKFDIRQFHEVS